MELSAASRKRFDICLVRAAEALTGQLRNGLADTSTAPAPGWALGYVSSVATPYTAASTRMIWVQTQHRGVL